MTRYYLPPILLTALILIAANDHLSAEETGGFLAALFGNGVALEIANYLLRKLAHLTEYGVLCALAFRAIRTNRKGWRLGWAAGAVLYVIVVASADEYLQSRTQLRTGTPVDVVVDACGATLAQFVIRRRALHLAI
jgi:VanZ family protein